ncbi:MAG: restriction endonuclease [Verrucomicrobia bacterium]|nr:restriction endonuclease [Verrucomicrobiota bacterium]
MIEADPSTKVDELHPRWTGEVIAGLDWMRITQLTRALSTSYGFKLGKTTLSADGQTDFVITRGDAPVEDGTLVRLTRWNQWMAAGECLMQLTAELEHRQMQHGMFISPGGFTPAARLIAEKSGIELLDSEMMALRLNELPAQHRDYFFNLATAGEATSPSCPICLRTLKLVDDRSTGLMNRPHLPEIRYAGSDIIGVPIRARRVEVLPYCEVQFLQEVRTGELIVHGRVTGDFVCEGSVVLHPGALLKGSVAAKSVIVRPGADMLGETRILNGKPESFGKSRPVWLWRCETPNPMPGCELVEFLKH